MSHKTNFPPNQNRLEMNWGELETGAIRNWSPEYNWEYNRNIIGGKKNGVVNSKELVSTGMASNLDGAGVARRLSWVKQIFPDKDTNPKLEEIFFRLNIFW